MVIIGVIQLVSWKTEAVNQLVTCLMLRLV